MAARHILTKKESGLCPITDSCCAAVPQALGPPAPPLDFVLDGFGLDSALGVLGGNADTEEARQ
eukprot:889073-Pelagomonas_calceolata.AAC.1